MPLDNLLGFKPSSTSVKVAVIAAIAVILIIAGVGLTSYFKDAAYEKREAKAAEEREVLFTERQQLQLEKAQLQGRLAEQEAVNETLKQVAVSKRTDTVATVKEIEALEKEHEQRKTELEATGSTLSDDALRRELCERLRARGYKLTCTN